MFRRAISCRRRLFTLRLRTDRFSRMTDPQIDRVCAELEIVPDRTFIGRKMRS
jgi:hypothetical protein